MILPFEHVESSEQRGRAVALVIMGHRPAAAGLQRQAQLGAVERLDLRFLIEAEHDGMRRRVDIEPNDVAQLQRHRHQEFIRFLNTIEATIPAGRDVGKWLERRWNVRNSRNKLRNLCCLQEVVYENRSQAA